MKLSLFHTWRLTDEVLIRAGRACARLSERIGLQRPRRRPRHEIEAQAGIFKQGFGGFVRVAWQSGRGSRAAPARRRRPRFGDLATVNLNLFADLGQRPALVRRFPWLEGTQIRFGIDNLFNARPRSATKPAPRRSATSRIISIRSAARSASESASCS